MGRGSWKVQATWLLLLVVVVVLLLLVLLLFELLLLLLLFEFLFGRAADDFVLQFLKLLHQ